MPDVVTPLSSREAAPTAISETAPRHRRDGHFDDHDQWHDDPDAPISQPLTVRA